MPRTVLPPAFATDFADNRLVFVPKGPVLIVSFDNGNQARHAPRDRPAWGQGFYAREGHSVLGVVAHQVNWFRDRNLHAALLHLKAEGFFLAFDRVILTGASMGGFGATAFASLSPGCTVLAFCPQSSRNLALAPFENLFSPISEPDWPPPFADGAAESLAASRVYLIYDPFEPRDRLHAARFTGGNVVKLPMPFMGHALTAGLNQLGLLRNVTRLAFGGALDPLDFARTMRARRNVPQYWTGLVRNLLFRRRFNTARRVMALADRRLSTSQSAALWAKIVKLERLADAGADLALTQR